MNQEILNKANNLRSVINDLEEHRNQQVFDSKNKVKGLELCADNSSSRRLLEDCLPIDLNAFRTLYIMRLDAKITDLEKQFENLKTD